jgi:hypothetical protein
VRDGVRAPVLPAVLLLALAAAAVSFGGLEGVGFLALGGAFLVAFSLLLFRRATTDMASVRHRHAEADRNFLWTVVLGGMALRVAVAFLLRLAGWNERIAPDEFTFHENAQWFSAWMRGDVAQPFAFKWGGSVQVGYFAVSGALYGTFGEYPFVPILLNCVLGGLCAHPAYLLAARVSGRRAGRAAALLVTFFPSLVLWSALLIRDACVLFFLLWTVCLAQSLVSRFRFRTALWLVVCLASLLTLRSYLVMLMAAATGIALLAAAMRRPGRAFAAALVCGVAVVALVKFGDAGNDFFSDTALENLAQRRQYNAIGGDSSISLEGFDLSTPGGALAYLPVGLCWFLLSPFPWQYAGNQRYAIPEVLIWYVCIPFVVAGAAFALRRRRRVSIQPLTGAILVTLLYSLVEGNVGIIFRHRAQALALLLPFAAIGWERRRMIERRRAREAVAAAERSAAPARRPAAVTA